MITPLADQILDRLTFLDPLAERIQHWIGARLSAGGPAARGAKDLLNGTWLGHPLHPALTDLPLGAWSGAAVLDLLSGGEATALGRGADVLVGLGCAGGAAAAVTGIADWQDSYGRERRTGLAHALLNTGALACFTGSLLLRLGGARRPALLLSTAGFGAAMGAGYLGGDLVFRHGAQVNRNAWVSGPRRWTAVADEAEVPEGALVRREAKGVPVLLTRRGATLSAVAAVCPHAGGPLQEGGLEDQVVTCPWHGSAFDTTDGRVLHGPACVALPVYEVRVTDGKVEVRAAPSA